MAHADVMQEIQETLGWVEERDARSLFLLTTVL